YQGAENRNRWVIQLQGGGSCSTPQDCANRWCSKDTSFGMQGMSANASPTVGINGRGILARPRTDNPLAGFNHVFVRYCSSDQWSGTRGPVTVEVDDPAGKLGKVKLTLYFNGHDIIEAVLRTLRRDGVAPLSYDDGQSQSEMPDLDDATQVLFAGGSGGGAGVIHNLDHVGTLLRQSNTNCQGSSCALAYAGLVDSITGPYRWNLDYSTTTLCTAPELQVCDYEAHIRLQNEAGSTFLWGAINDDSCNPWHQAHDPQNEWRCGDKDHILRHHLTTPFFVRMGLQDSNLTSGYSDVHYTVPGQGLLDEALFGALVRQQLLELPSIAQTAEEKDAITRAPGAFGPACARHVTIDDNPSTYGVTLSDGNDDYTMFQLMGNWLKGTQPQVLVAPDLDQSSCP
ncbi:MAG: hypothetical protein KC609_10850, partial [Myxococcales bacterium]|nr:hypothetical protein [Myxococcales bacterium]